MAVTYTVEFRVRARSLKAFHEHLTAVLDAMRHEATFREAVLHVDPDDDHHLMLYETWASHEDVLTVQIPRAYRDAWHAALPDVLVEPRRVGVWTPLRADRR